MADLPAGLVARGLTGRLSGLFGTNHPMIITDRALADLTMLGPDEETTEPFLTGNARRVFTWIPATARRSRNYPPIRLTGTFRSAFDCIGHGFRHRPLLTMRQ